MTTREPSEARLIAKLLGRRLAIGVVMMIVVSLLVFTLTQALPGDIVRQVLGQTATPGQITRLRAELGLDKPLVVQYLHWLGGMVSGDFGSSLASHTPVADLLASRIQNTATLVAITIVITVPLAVALGVLSARRPGGVADHLVSASAQLVLSLPEFVVGIIFILLFATNVTKVLPPTSVLDSRLTAIAQPQLLILPVLTLVVTASPYLIESVKTAMRDELVSEHVRWARLSGIGENRVIVHFGLRNALPSSIQVAAMTVAYLLGGTVAIETVFSFPGLGAELVDAVAARDIPVVQAIVMIVGAASLVGYILADLAVILLTPRVRTAVA